MYKKILPLCVGLSLSASPAYAQIRIAFGGGYDYTQSAMLNKAIQYYNFSHPVWKHQPLSSGWYGSLEASYQLLAHLYLTARGVHHRASARLDNPVSRIQTQLIGYGGHLGADFYFSQGISDYSGAYLHGLYLSTSVGLGLIQHRFLREDEPIFYNGKTYDTSRIAFAFEGGLGYDIHTRDWFSLTPEVRLMYYPTYGFEGTYEAYYGGPLDDPDALKRGLLFLQAGLLFKFHTQASRY